MAAHCGLGGASEGGACAKAPGLIVVRVRGVLLARPASQAGGGPRKGTKASFGAGTQGAAYQAIKSGGRWGGFRRGWCRRPGPLFRAPFCAGWQTSTGKPICKSSLRPTAFEPGAELRVLLHRSMPPAGDVLQTRPPVLRSISRGSLHLSSSSQKRCSPPRSLVHAQPRLSLFLLPFFYS